LKREDLKKSSNEMKNYLVKNFVKNDVLKKMLAGNDLIGIDASSIWIFTKFNVFELDEKITKNTVKNIQRYLGNVAPRRYLLEKEVEKSKFDQYYGGGRWLPLACALGEYYLVTNDFEMVTYKVENEDLYLIATSEHPMGAMFADEVFDKNSLGSWSITHKGPACPLAWSHAAYLVLYEKIKEQI